MTWEEAQYLADYGAQIGGGYYNLSFPGYVNVQPAPAPIPPPDSTAPPGPLPTPTPSPPNPSTVPAIVSSTATSGGAILLDQIPLAALPSQITTVQLGSQSVRLIVFQKRTGLYLDLFVNDASVLRGALCLDRVWILRDAYLGFEGDLAFVDTQGSSDPNYRGLADRFQLVWGHG